MKPEIVAKEFLKLVKECGGFANVETEQREAFYSDWLRSVMAENSAYHSRKFAKRENEIRSRLLEEKIEL